MITYSCNEIDQRGVCLPDKMSVFVSSRERSISDEKKDSLIPVLNQLCVNPDTLIRYNNDGEILTPKFACRGSASQQNKFAMSKFSNILINVSVDCEIQMSTSPSCQVQKTPILKKFDIKKVISIFSFK